MAVIENGVYPKLRQFKRENSCYPLDFGELCSIKPMYIYIYVCVSIYVYLCMYVSIYLCIYIYVYLFINIRADYKPSSIWDAHAGSP